MIDIHSHVLPFIDDGAVSTEVSLAMLEELRAQGVTDVICTPHFRKPKYVCTKRQIVDVFNNFAKQAEQVGVNLYLGQEIATSKPLLKQDLQDDLLTINNTNYVLLEFDYNNRIDVDQICYETKVLGYIPIIAHVERYTYLSIADIAELKQNGALIQINASSVCAGLFDKRRKKVFELIKRGLVDFVASDYHSFRTLNLKNAHARIQKKFGVEVANKLFKKNAEVLIK